MGLLIKCKFKTSSGTIIGTRSTVILTGGQLKIVLGNIILETYSKKMYNQKGLHSRTHFHDSSSIQSIFVWQF